ncbi:MULTISPECIES: hypothetical protein [Halorussus]|uniref:hypothetical protein n=1 Tax=Halorussus TaxID=1070314 RepID=UPI0020A0B00F|nr:hypothetical protein [Halorussus vallis]USZ78582.1 hypothetical protein NGM07_24855 [Halorussus vallis]
MAKSDELTADAVLATLRETTDPMLTADEIAEFFEADAVDVQELVEELAAEDILRSKTVENETLYCAWQASGQPLIRSRQDAELVADALGTYSTGGDDPAESLAIRARDIEQMYAGRTKDALESES